MEGALVEDDDTGASRGAGGVRSRAETRIGPTGGATQASRRRSRPGSIVLIEDAAGAADGVAAADRGERRSVPE
jgi:hypothetical protein